MAEQQNTPISVDGYRKSVYKEFTVTVPSGALFKVKRLSPIDFINEGIKDMPNEYLTMAYGGKVPEMSEEEKKKAEETFVKFITTAITMGIVEPKVMIEFDKEKSKTHLCWSEIDEKDQNYLISVILQGRANPKN